MDELWKVLPAGLAAIAAFLYLRSSYAHLRAAPLWAAAWCVLVLTGVLGELDRAHPIVEPLTAVAAYAFAALFLAGALAFTRHPMAVPLSRWSWLGLPVVGLLFLRPSPPAQLVSGLICAGMLLASALRVWRYARATKAAAAEYGLAALIFGLATLRILDPDQLGAPHAAAVTAWLVLGFSTGAFQLVSLVERAGRRQQEVREERRLLRRVADLAREPGDADRLLARLAEELGAAAVAPLIGVWKREGDVLRLLPSPRGPRLPRDLRHVGLDDGLGRRAVGAEGAMRLVAEDDPALASVAWILSDGDGFFAPVRMDGELVGVLVAVFSPSPSPLAERTEFVEELAQVVASALRVARAREEAERQAYSLEVGRSNTRALLEAVPVGILLTDGSGRIQLMNRTIAAQFDLGAPEAWLGKEVQDVMLTIRGRLERAVRPHLDAHLLRLGGSQVLPLDAFELRFPEDDGRVLWMSAQAVRGPDGTPLGRVWVTHDVTAERRIVERMQHADRMETLGTLAGGLAHDFNNQLTGILGNARLLLHELPEDAAATGPLQDLERAAEHCAELTQGLLAFARQGPRADGSVHLNRLFLEIEALLRPSLGPAVKLEVRTEPGIPPAAADATELRRVVTNLLLNARDAVGEEGSIVLQARSIDGGQSLEVTVTDDGVGMDAATKRRIFDPFYTTKGKGHGTGLGLAVVYGIVEAHGGSIAVRSSLGRGSMFRVVWPAAKLQAPLQERGELPFGPTGEGTILLAEDEPGVRRMTRAALERAGYRVLEAEDGEAAIKLFDAHVDEVDLLLFDLSMPGCDGLTAVESIRARAPGLPALVMSGHPDRDRSWPEDVPLLPKPFGPTVLLQQVGGLLASR